ncbi:glycosyltransferase family 4 protein [Streptomyces sp. CNQ085]|uniref:glycosyltransferase family 4 protein n=1 Tax=Streptomyces sp. CNQ085 TaxID=2886944 RepID=UPI001F5095FD|nr:glycosyltransferase family 4 protein [Streptomyces sp. CNQ085]MCI0385341.1 glycosyltransferase family 4 protein [Streptomyces sp. CNQ085]
MKTTPVPPRGRPPLHVVQVIGGGSARVCTHVRSLTAGLVARGVRVTVCAPPGTEPDYGFTGLGARFVPLPRGTGPEAAAVLRAVCADAGVVHAHGLRAGVPSALALCGRRRTPLVVTWHARARSAGVRAWLMMLLERRVVRAARVVFGTTSDLVDRARRHGARDARLAPVTVSVTGGTYRGGWPGGPDGMAREKTRAELGVTGRPLVLAVGRLVPRQGHTTLLTASRAWRRLDPQPLLAIAGEGPTRPALQRRIDAEKLPVRLLGRRTDALDLLAAADVAVLPARWEGRAVVAQEALRAGVPLVASAVGGLPELVGDAALLVPYGDADALAEAVGGLLGDPARRSGLAAAGRAQAATWPSEDDTVAQVLSVYDELAPQGG